MKYILYALLGLLLSAPAISAEISKLAFTSPLESDYLPGGGGIDLSTTWTGAPVSFYWASASASSSKWNPITGSVWDTSALPTGQYFLLAKAGGRQAQISINLDTSLRKGFPARVPYNPSPLGGIMNPGEMEPVAADLDSDGYSEILVHTRGWPSTLVAYSSDGKFLWKSEVGDSHEESFYWPIIPTLADLNNDGRPEILVPVSNHFEEPRRLLIYAFYGDGKRYDGWAENPIVLPFSLGATIAAADLNHDGNMDIVSKPNSFAETASTERWLSIINSDGQVERSFLIPNPDIQVSSTRPIFPSLGNFDDDSDLEIVFIESSSCTDTRIHIFNADSSEVDGWPRDYPYGTPAASPAIGDMNGDGIDDMAISLSYAGWPCPSGTYGGIIAVSGKGEMLPGFPAAFGSSFGSVALADVDDDKRVEIASSSGNSVYVFESNGQVKSGWPHQMDSPSYGSPVIADISPQPGLEVLSAGTSYLGGTGNRLYAWGADGNPISGFPKGTEIHFMATPLISDLDSDGSYEIIGTSDSDGGFAKNRGSIYVWETEYQTKERYSSFWPAFHQNMAHTGRMELPYASSAKGELLQAAD